MVVGTAPDKRDASDTLPSKLTERPEVTNNNGEHGNNYIRTDHVALFILTDVSRTQNGWKKDNLKNDLNVKKKIYAIIM